MNETSETETESRLAVPVHPALVGRMRALLDAPEFHFRDLEDFVRAALLSFTNYKEHELARIRQEEKPW